MKLSISIPTMRCGGCVNGVTRAVEKVDKDATVRTDLATHEAVVETRASEADILASLEKAGFPAIVR
ncbi:heavy-metal-associated domain-containing protein [Acuticoccus sp. I52.16.1]|uniref:heavy-metal-associated domain-containing protein n=1 Tax=Acuticoccus sp. I52.16.1 TaxID=2928472 RepID=UPI001FD4E74F|nr:heavy-metal-associated domain-containing protein [Acuticoccus sp. I52.16.1]UOM37119.1 heavy-metal-associated domain-containing protein [Acuticoccus sp. I52.16.1]